MTADVTEKENNGTEDDTEQTESRDPGKGKPAGAIISGFIALVAVFISIFAVYKSMYTEEQLEAAYGPMRDRIDEVQSSLNGLRSIQNQLEQSHAEVKAIQDSILARLTAIGRDRSDAGIEWTLAEIEHLLVIAAQRLALEHDVTVALAALQSADDRLRNTDDPGLLQIRKQLTSDINALKSVNKVDILGLTLYLADIASRVDSLPLKRIQGVEGMEGEHGEVQDEEGVSDKPILSRIGDEIMETLGDLVKIYPQGEGTVITLLPEQRYYLYQNLRLQFEIARLAVMRRETQTFHASIEIIQDWFKKYFDTDDAGIINIQDSLSRMSKLELKPELPDISSSLETVRSVIKELNDDSTGTGETGGNRTP